MRLSVGECRTRLAAARVATLATTGQDMRPHVVPVTFALDTDRMVTAIDQKPKTTTNLRRLRNITENPRVALLGDLYDDDWTRLWWVRADGHATVVGDGDERRSAVELLSAKYPQYDDDPPGGPVIVIDVQLWTGWAHSS